MSSTPARIHRLRLSGGPRTADALSSVREWLQANPPERHGLPPEAIVLLRHLRAPLSALRRDRGQGPLHDALRQASRPAQGPHVGAACGAVWFADEAELLGCLAHDTVRGELGRAWWWHTLLGTTPGTEHAVQRWLQHARVAPRAMAQLSPNEALAWAQAMGPGGRRALCLSLAQAHPIPAGWVNGLADRCAQPGGVPSGAEHASQGQRLRAGHAEPDGRDRDAAEAARGRDPGASAAGTQPRQPAPRPALGVGAGAGAGPADLATGPELLIHLCHLLHHAPHFGLSVGTHGSTHGGMHGSTDDPTDGSALARLMGGDRGGPRAAATPSAAPPPNPGRRPSATGSLVSPVAASSASANGPTTAQQTATHPHDAPAPGNPDAPAHGSPTGRAPQVRASKAATREGVPARPGEGQGAPASPHAAARMGDGSDPLLTSFHTPFGGLFFLLNVALAWELYGDFTRPRQAGLSVSPWQFLHAAGLALVGRPFRADPLAAWLRSRAPFQRPQPLATDWQPPRELPTDLVADAQARWQRRAHRPNELSVWWPLLRRRLERALNLPADQDPVRLTLCLGAHVRCRAERVDVHLSLAHLPLAVRLAGLDRDPGWVPAAGCDLRFHFEGPTP